MLAEVFQPLLQTAQEYAAADPLYLRAPVDPDQISPAQYGTVTTIAGLDGEWVAWRPVSRPEPADFSSLEQALELQLPDDVKAFYGGYYGGNLACQHSRGNLDLLLVWHDADLRRLQENIIAHVLMKRRLKQRDTIFIAATDDDDWLISVLVADGAVYAEQVGREVSQCLAPSLADFIAQLQLVPPATE